MDTGFILSNQPTRPQGGGDLRFGEGHSPANQKARSMRALCFMPESGNRLSSIPQSTSVSSRVPSTSAPDSPGCGISLRR